MKQLGLAFHLYVDDNEDTFPGAGAKLPTQPVMEDWIYWNITDSRISNPVRRDVQNSAISKHIGGFNPNLLRCPSDKDVLRRMANPLPGQIPYLYSYTLNSYYIAPAGTTTSLNDNHGPASLFAGDPSVDNLPFRSAAIRNPSDKIMLVEEYADFVTPDDGRWTPTTTRRADLAHPPPFGSIPSYISGNRHSGKGVVTLCDGHVETVKPSFGNMPQHFDCLYDR